MKSIHTIPVPRHMDACDAWDEIKVMGCLVEYRWWKPKFWRCHWATVEVYTED